MDLGQTLAQGTGERERIQPGDPEFFMMLSQKLNVPPMSVAKLMTENPELFAQFLDYMGVDAPTGLPPLPGPGAQLTEGLQEAVAQGAPDQYGLPNIGVPGSDQGQFAPGGSLQGPLAPPPPTPAASAPRAYDTMGPNEYGPMDEPTPPAVPPPVPRPNPMGLEQGSTDAGGPDVQKVIAAIDALTGVQAPPDPFYQQAPAAGAYRPSGSIQGGNLGAMLTQYMAQQNKAATLPGLNTAIRRY